MTQAQGTDLRQDGFKSRPKHNPKPQKPKGWSHQDELTAFKGKSIAVKINMGGSFHSHLGILLDADQFTIKMMVYDNAIMVVFKHAIISLSLVEKGQ